MNIDEHFSFALDMSILKKFWTSKHCSPLGIKCARLISCTKTKFYNFTILQF